MKQLKDRISLLFLNQNSIVPTTHSYFSCHLAITTVGRVFYTNVWNKRKIRWRDARPRYCTATCCTPGALPHHNKLWFIKYYYFSKKYSPGCAFPPQAARRRHNRFKYNTKTTYHVWNDDFWQRYCVMTRGEKLRSLGWVRSALVSQPGHWRSNSLFTLRDAQSDSRIFFQLFISVANRVSFSFNKGLLCLNVFTDSPVSGGDAGAVLRATRCTGRIILLAVRAALPLFFVFVGACCCQACLRSLRYCLAVCLSA